MVVPLPVGWLAQTFLRGPFLASVVLYWAEEWSWSSLHLLQSSHY